MVPDHEKKFTIGRTKHPIAPITEKYLWMRVFNSSIDFSLIVPSNGSTVCSTCILCSMVKCMITRRKTFGDWSRKRLKRFEKQNDGERKKITEYQYYISRLKWSLSILGMMELTMKKRFPINLSAIKYLEKVLKSNKNLKNRNVRLL